MLCRCRGFAEAGTARKVGHTVSGRFGTEHVAGNGLKHHLVEETTASSCLAASGSTGSGGISMN